MIAFGRPIRRRFLLEPGTAFLNHGSFGATPRGALWARISAQVYNTPADYQRLLAAVAKS